MQQIAIYPKQAAGLLGVSDSAAVRLFNRIRRATGKGRGTLVSVGEFCHITGLPEAEVRAALRP